MNQQRGLFSLIACVSAVACNHLATNGTGGSGGGEASAGPLGTGGTLNLGSNVLPTTGGGSGIEIDYGDGGSGVILGVVRDFRFYSASDSTTNPDFEHVPTTSGSWDDTGIVADTLGADGKPVYKSAAGQTLTTHGKAAFDQWYNDVPGTNYHVDYPLPIALDPDAGTYGYDSNLSGQPYAISQMQGNGFFPIDDGTQYSTPFGNQGKPHNYSFTFELHTVFTYRGGETFNFRGDDDVFVFINKQLVINLGGIHNPEPKSVSVDSLNLTVGKSYPLDFFSAERHVVGSNIEFTTTLQLQPIPNVR